MLAPTPNAEIMDGGKLDGNKKGGRGNAQRGMNLEEGR